MTFTSAIKRTAALTVLLLFGLEVPHAQRSGAPAAARPKPIVFAVLNDGKSIEPIGYFEKNSFASTIDGASQEDAIFAFHKTYYRAGTKYRLIFGGADAGTLRVNSSDPTAECSRNAAEVAYTSQRARLRGNVMAIATNIPATTKGSGVRRLPTATERTEIEALVRAYLTDQKLAAATVRTLKYHNLTAVDADGDGNAELIGTFWVEPARTSRALLFFIAEREQNGKYSFAYSDYRLIKQDDVMSGEIAHLDEGVYHERLLELLDTDGDGTAEIFTYIQSFEGAGFNVYRREKGKWKLMFEAANYRCAF